MVNRTKAKTLALILMVLLALVTIGLLIYGFWTEKTVNPSSLLRAGLILAGLGIAFGKLLVQREPRRSPKIYRETYGDLIGNAFWTDKRAEALFCRALDAYNASLYTSALNRLEQLEKLAHSSDDRFAVAVFTALCYDDMKQPKQAIAYYQKALLQRENSTVYSNMGMSHRALGDLNRALEAYDDAIRLDPSNAYAYNNAANVLIDLDDYETALHYAKKATEFNQRLRQAHTAQAICYAMLMDPENYEIAARHAVSCGESRARLEAAIQALQGRPASDE